MLLRWLKGKNDKRSGDRSESERELRLNIILPGGALLPCDIDYLDREGGSLSFPDKRSLQPGQRVRFKFVTDSRMEAFVTDAMILKSRSFKGRRFCQFRFREVVDLEVTLGSGVFSRFNRRRAFRVEPSAGDEIGIDLLGEGKVASGNLVDISTTGMGVGITVNGLTADMSRGFGGIFKPLDQVTLSFQPSGCDTILRVTGIIRNRKPKGKKNRYGVDFQWDQSDESQRQEEAIRSYVMRQQQFMLERSAWIRRG